MTQLHPIDSHTNQPVEETAVTKKAAFPLKWLFLSGIFLILLWGGIKGWRIYQVGQSLLTRQTQAESLLAGGGMMDINPDDAESLVMGIRSDVYTLKKEISFLLPLLPRLSWLPNEYGEIATAAPHLFAMADAGTETAAYAFRGLKPALAILQDDTIAGDNRIPQLIQTLDQAAPDLAKASQVYAGVIAARSQIKNVEALPWRIQNLLSTTDPLLPLGQDGLKLAGILPELMGINEPRFYLVMAQNEDELRPTGGFISGAGLLVMANGQIVELDFGDANLVDAWGDPSKGDYSLTKPYESPPKPLQDFMQLDLFLFRDANFWPNFPISAEQAMNLYAYGQDLPPLDGAIAIDQHFMQLLVEATGPIPIDGGATIIDSKNVVTSLQNAWNLDDGTAARKSFLAIFAKEMQSRIVGDFQSIDPVTLVKNMFQAADSKDLQIYMRDPAVAAVFEDIGWDGRFPTRTTGDFLMIADTSVGYNKAAYYIERETSYHVTIDGNDRATAQLDITHIHTSPDNGEACSQGTVQEYIDKAPYLALADKCYWNYLRVYTPAGTQLTDSPEHLVPAESWLRGIDWQEPTKTVNEQAELTTYANFLMVPRASRVSSQYQYALPENTVQVDGNLKTYTLQVLKQAGVRPYPIEIVIEIPAGKDLIDVIPLPKSVIGSEIHFFVTDFASDSEYTVIYR